MKKRHLLATSILVFALFSGSTFSAFGASKSATDYKVFTGSVPDFGILVSWGVNFKLSAEYNTGSSQYYLTRISTSANINPKRGDTSNGQIMHSVAERIDYGNATNRPVAPSPSSFWKFPGVIEPPTSLTYYSCYGNPNKYFMYEAEEKGNSYFSIPEGIIHNPNHTLILSVSGPK